MVICKNCYRRFDGKFCLECGQSAAEGRIDLHYLLHDVPHSVFHIDQGFFYTLGMLFSKPGVMIQEYLAGKRIRHFRPFAYVMIMTAISSLLVKVLEWAKTDVLRSVYGVSPALEHANFFEHYFSVFVFIMIPFASVVTWLVFIRREYNFWEHFLANTYIAAQLNIIWILMHLVSLIAVLFTGSDYSTMGLAFFVVFMSFFLYMYGSVFGFLMKGVYKLWKLVLILSGMNLILYFVYSIGFHLAGIWQMY